MASLPLYNGEFPVTESSTGLLEPPPPDSQNRPVSGVEPVAPATETPAFQDKGPASLDTTADNLSAERRRWRYALRETSRELTERRRHRLCGHAALAGGVAVKVKDGAAFYSGLVTCGLVWECPCCAARIAAARAGEVNAALSRHLGDGGGALFLTLTLPHDYGQPLRPMRATISDAFSKTLGGRGWQALKVAYGVEYIRALEVTVGDHGWHPHLHVLLLTKAPLSEADEGLLYGHIFKRWCSRIERDGYRAPEAFLCPVERVTSTDVAGYVTKFAAALELTRWDVKTARGGSRHPFRILADIREYGDPRDIDLWAEWTDGMAGAKQLTWSKGTKARLGVVTLEDEDVVTAEPEEAETVALLRREAWQEVRDNPALVVGLLEAAETGGREAVIAFLGRLPWQPGFRPVWDMPGLAAIRGE